jgi:predicted dehydrogenase
MIDIALIGYGYFGKKIYQSMKENNHYNIRYVYYRSLSCRDIASVQSDLGMEFINNIDIIWNDHGLKNVFIATPINTHYSLIKEALHHKKNVFVEKPMVLSILEAEDIRDVSYKEQLHVVTEYTYTFSQALLKARKLITDGVLGKILSVQIIFKQLGRFMEYDVYTLLGSHALSILDMFIPINSLNFTSTELLWSNDVVSGGVLSFSNEHITGTIDLNLHSPIRDKKVSIYCERGTLVYDQFSENNLHVTLFEKSLNALENELVVDKLDFQFNELSNIHHGLNYYYDVILNNEIGNLERSLIVTSVLDSIHREVY